MSDNLNDRILAALGGNLPNITVMPASDEPIEVTPATDDMLLDQLVNEWFDHKAAIEKHGRQLVEAAELILQKLPAGQKHEIAPGVGVTIRQPSRSYNAETAAKLLTDEERAACTVTQLDQARVKALLKARHVIDQAMDAGTGKPSVVAL